MPLAKKRRASSENDYKDDEVSSKRFKKISSYNPQEICQDLYEIVRNQKTEDGRLLCEPFIRAPKRRNEPDYYVTVNTPMDLLKIQHRVKSEEYDAVEEMSADFELMINNAKSFYQPESMEYKQAVELWNLFQHSKTQLVSQALGESFEDKKEITETDEEASTSTTISELLHSKHGQSTPMKIPILKLKVVPNSGEPASVSADSTGRADQSGTMDESSRSCFSNALTSGSEAEEETKVTKTPNSGQKKKRRSKKAIQAMMVNEESSTSHLEDDETLIEQLFSAAVTASDDTRCFTDMFRILPSKTKFPEYYQVIKEPMDLRLIARKIQSSSYANLDALTKDILLIVNNAKTFNEPGSKIYKDATSLKKFVLNKKLELEQAKQVRSQRTRGRNSTHHQQSNLSSVFAALKSESDEETTSGMPEHHRGTDGECSGEDSSESEQWFLYNAVRNFKDSNDQALCEPFLRLPSKRFYPDYYLEIKKPMSMMKIHKKIKGDLYQDLEGVASDFNLVFDNAKQYNREDSRIYQDAETLQKVMQNKYFELVRSKEVTHELMEHHHQKNDVDGDDGSKKKKRNLYALYKTVFETQIGGRGLIDMFVTLPSKKDYPDYYRVISQPIDMTIIEHKIRADKYPNIISLANDLELMFKNARHYNEESSQVYKDAEMLEKIMQAKMQQIIQLEQANRSLSPAVAGVVAVAGDKAALKNPQEKMQDLFGRIKDYMDSKGRILSTPFMKLPHRNDYPDYYEVITKPMDLNKIQQRLAGGMYVCIDDMMADLGLVFNNAMIYNEPDSQIYKDAVSLMKLCNEGRIEINDESMKLVPHVSGIVQKIFRDLVTDTINHSDEDGRRYSDAFCDLMIDGNASRQFQTFEEILEFVEAGAYKRLDCLQDDVFKLCDFARNQSSISSQLYEDTVEVQTFFLKRRDELCRGEDVLQSPALLFTHEQLNGSIQREKRDKLAVESLMGNNEGREAEEDGYQLAAELIPVSREYNGQVYSRGDFVYIEPREVGLSPHIVSIEKIFTQNDQTFIYGCWFLRPNETFHAPNKKFIEKEVFKSEFRDSVPFEKVYGKCSVMHIKQFISSQPVGVPWEDVYVCESRYCGRRKLFKKLKSWEFPMSPNVKFVVRDRPVLPVRVSSFPSCRSSQVVQHVDKLKKVVVLENVLNGEPGATYYEQLKTTNHWLRIGDCVVVKNSLNNEKITIIRIDKLWTTSRGEPMLSGVLFYHPGEIDGSGAPRLFYRKEMLLSNREEIRSCSEVVQLVSVLSSRDYCLCRCTHVDEQDVYVCDFKFNEADRSFKKFNKPLKHPCLSSSVCEDEVLYFKKPLVITREFLASHSSKVSEVKLIEEESMDFCSSVGDQSLNESSSFIGESNNGAGDLTPLNSKKRKKRTTKIRNITGYIVYAGECRKDIQAEFPDLNFGDISRAVGTRWKNLPREIKEKYEEKARIMLADANLKVAESQFSSAVPSPGGDSRSMSPSSSLATAPRATSQLAMDNSFQQSTGIVTAGLGATGLTGLQQQQQQQPSLQSLGAPLFVSVPPRTQKVVHSEAYLRYIHNLARGNKQIGDFDKTFAAKKPETVVLENSKLPSHWLGSGPGHHGDVVSALWAMREHMLRDALSVPKILF